VPTIAESLPGYEVESWQGIFVPAKTPREIVDKMNGAVVKVMAEKTLVDKLNNTAYTPVSTTPEGLRDFLKADTDKWAGIIKAAGLKID
jgi:tripartite-type tricarboxylate transporter receptor subunit TctC